MSSLDCNFLLKIRQYNLHNQVRVRETLSSQLPDWLTRKKTAIKARASYSTGKD